jgi:hypothetical protein
MHWRAGLSSCYTITAVWRWKLRLLHLGRTDGKILFVYICIFYSNDDILSPIRLLITVYWSIRRVKYWNLYLIQQFCLKDALICCKLTTRRAPLSLFAYMTACTRTKVLGLGEPYIPSSDLSQPQRALMLESNVNLPYLTLPHNHESQAKLYLHHAYCTASNTSRLEKRAFEHDQPAGLDRVAGGGARNVIIHPYISWSAAFLAMRGASFAYLLTC